MNYNLPREHCYKIDKDDYKEVYLSIINEYWNYVRKYYRVYRLIWETFNNNIPDNLTIDHIDGNKTNNSLNNLRLLTREKNTSTAYLNIPLKYKYIYALFQNNISVDYIIENNYPMYLILIVIRYKDYYNYFKNIGFDIQFVGSVEDIEKVAYY